MERGAVTKSQEGRKASVERKAGKCYQWKAIGQCSEGNSRSFSHDPASGNRRGQRQEGRSSSPAPKAAEEKVFLEQEVRFRADISLRESV